jgi:hypothetical protein
MRPLVLLAPWAAERAVRELKDGIEDLHEHGIEGTGSLITIKNQIADWVQAQKKTHSHGR